MTSDGGLRRLFRKYLPKVHWTTIESRLTESGIPDLNGCYEGVDFWVECKAARGWRVNLRPMQIAWILRRLRCGGKCWIAIRRRNRKLDQLILIPGEKVEWLAAKGLKGIPLGVMHCWNSGPREWPWPEVAAALADVTHAAKLAGR